MFGAIANIDADVTGGIGHGGMFKKLTGGDKKVSARHPYGKPFSYAPTTKQLYSANQVPETKVDDTAFFRRWLIVEFPNEYTDADKPGPDNDPALEDHLLDELPGILNWAIEGLERLLDQGHFMNEGETEDKRHRWQSWVDTVDKFISECIEVGGNQKYTSSETYERYVAFCREVLEETPESQRTLTDQLKKLPDIRYSGDFRFNGKKARGFKGLKFGWEPLNGEDIKTNGQSTLPQADAYQLIIATITEMEADDPQNSVSIDSVIEACSSEVGNSNRVSHIIGNLVDQKRLYRSEEGHVRSA
jgi:putative DNA primase/helicase